MRLGSADRSHEERVQGDRFHSAGHNQDMVRHANEMSRVHDRARLRGRRQSRRKKARTARGRPPRWPSSRPHRWRIRAPPRSRVGVAPSASPPEPSYAELCYRGRRTPPRATTRMALLGGGGAQAGASQKRRPDDAAEEANGAPANTRGKSMRNCGCPRRLWRAPRRSARRRRPRWAIQRVKQPPCCPTRARFRRVRRLARRTRRRSAGSSPERLLRRANRGRCRAQSGAGRR